ncbi:fungal pheromone mating factor STE2 GPCR-domain-containing protein [Dipodascopsis tothii]|uniref:fungal pheromone mating factor STE2 GPCR-domain-containing protein n=1 Tax=Dipodascopsis tothii TaxID=44089 RepID=UPI0034CE5EF3
MAVTRPTRRMHKARMASWRDYVPRPRTCAHSTRDNGCYYYCPCTRRKSRTRRQQGGPSATYIFGGFARQSTSAASSFTMSDSDVAPGFMTEYTPANQTIQYVDYEGHYQYSQPADFDSWTNEFVSMAAILGVQIGACTVMAITLALLSKPAKRLTPIFLLNQFSLMVLVVRGILYLKYITGPMASFASSFALYTDDIPDSAYSESYATSIMPMLVVIAVEISLILQVRIVYASNRHTQRVVTVLASMLGLVVVVFWILSEVNAYDDLYGLTVAMSQWPYTAAYVSYSVFIFACSGAFMYKLYQAIRQRRSLGLTQFGPLQIIFIMSLQTMILPAIMTVIQIAANPGFGYSSMTSLIVVISLPLSTLWASSAGEAGSSQSSVNSGYLFKQRSASSASSAETVSQHSGVVLDLEKQDEYARHWKSPSPVTVSQTMSAES